MENADGTEKTTAFSSAADYYEVLADKEGRLEREGPLLLEILAACPGKRVLDLACGTGLHALFFAEHGAQVTGRDYSAEMIGRAAQLRSHDRISYETGDMRETGGGVWDMAVCLGNSLSLLGGIEDVATTFRQVHECLEPGGHFLVQILNYASDKAQQPRHRVERKNVGGADIVAVKSLVPSGNHTLLSMAFHAEKDGAIHSISETAVLMNIRLQDLEEAGRNTGFEVAGFYGGFDKSPYDPAASSDIVAVFRRALM